MRSTFLASLPALLKRASISFCLRCFALERFAADDTRTKIVFILSSIFNLVRAVGIIFAIVAPRVRSVIRVSVPMLPIRLQIISALIDGGKEETPLYIESISSDIFARNCFNR
ncbi:MAG: hypothetical protein COT74_13745 [Bdellovibrionales bacterium CG10_big_fil_rev_8_21_14_0_10_45_34]|nr:MAG: hypothetical protein COT74_13745 [Bdellovibrionales bacterium CG10_big_fil_rev_8_21_14_0_10_45_34]